MSLKKPAVLSTVTLALIAIAIGVFALSGSNTSVSAQGTPASKAAVAIKELIGLSQTAGGPPNSENDTGGSTSSRPQSRRRARKISCSTWRCCGIVTDTTVKSSGGTQSSATARANIAVRVLVDGDPAEPDNSIDANKESAEGVVFCDRIQTLAAKFAGLNCTADPTTGVVTCTDPEELRLLLRTLNANAFNFAKDDVGVGVHSIVVQARAQASVNFDDDASGGALAGAEAFAGAGSLIVEEVRLVKDVQIVF